MSDFLIWCLASCYCDEVALIARKKRLCNFYSVDHPSQHAILSSARPSGNQSMLFGLSLHPW